MTLAKRDRRSAFATGAVLLVAGIAAACGGPSVSGAASATSTPPPSHTAAPPPGASRFPSPASGGALPSADVLRDPSLLALLPASIGAASVTEEPEAFAEAVSDPDFVASVAAAAFPIVVDGSDLASGVVARLRPGVFSETFFRDWRDTYNRGACAQAGGLVGNAEAQLGGRTTYIASCAGGLLVYHAWLEPRGVIVSLFSTGDGRFGERLMTGLRP